MTLVYCGQMVGWIKMKLGMQVGLAPGHIVLHADPAPPSPKGHTPNFWPMSIVANGWMDQDATWYGGRPQLRRQCVRWGPSSLLQQKGHSPQFSAHVYCGQTAVCTVPDENRGEKMQNLCRMCTKIALKMR